MIVKFEEIEPTLGERVFVADGARVIGDVHLGDEASVWYGAVLRGDVGKIRIGARTNIQDLTVIHVTTDMFDTTLGADVTVGHRAILHGCTIGNHALIGMGSTVMDGAEVGDYSIVGAGALVTPGTKIPSGVLAVGAPAKVVRELRVPERQTIEASAPHYVGLAQRHLVAARGV